jgi:hypothetical protein
MKGLKAITKSSVVAWTTVVSKKGVAATAAESNLEIIDDGVQSIMQRQVRHSARVILL